MQHEQIRAGIRGGVGNSTSDPRPYVSVYELKADVQVFDLRRGDLVVWAYSRQDRQKLRRAALGELRQARREELAGLGQELAGRLLTLGGAKAKAPEYFIRDCLTDRRRHQGYDYTCPLFIIRPWAQVSRPIQARTDGDAIAELLRQVGGIDGRE